MVRLKVVFLAAAIAAATSAVAGRATLADAQAKINAYTDNSGLVLRYTGKFDYNTITDVCAQWQKPAQTLQIKNKSNITIIGASDSSANFGIHIAGNAHNVIVQNMMIGLLQGGEAADSISIGGMSSGQPSNIWIDHNTIFASLT